MMGIWSRGSLPLILVAVSGGVISVLASAAISDPRLEIPQVRRCVDTVKSFLSSSEYSDDEENRAIIVACRDSDPECVSAVADGLNSHDRAQASKLLPLVKSCKGNGMGQCYRALSDRLPSYERNEISEAEALLKQCE